MGFKSNGSLDWEVTVPQGYMQRITANGPWECPGFLCQYYGYTAMTFRLQWNGSGRGWHMGGTWYDLLRN
jgi:hypothetical protein